MTKPRGTIDFFISYRGPQSAWARWINWVVRSAGFSTVLMDEFPVGTTWTSQMRDAAENSRRLIPLYSRDYWKSGACIEEFDAYWRQHLDDASERFLLPITIEKCKVPVMHAMLLTKRIDELDRDAAKAEILKVLAGIAAVVPATTPYGDPEPPFPGRGLTSGALSGPVAPVITPFPDHPDPIDRNGFLNCVNAFETFEKMLTQAASKRILLVHGQGNQGKSTLLSLFYNHTRSQFGRKSTARVEFKNPSSNPEDYVDSIARSLGIAFDSSGNIDRQVDAVLDECTDRPTVIFFDAYEHAELQHQHWVGKILDRCHDGEHLRCVIAGREVPNVKGKPWNHLVFTTECDPLKHTDAFTEHAITNGYKGRREDIVTMVSVFVSLRQRYMKQGRIDHGISAEVVLDEINSLIESGRVFV